MSVKKSFLTVSLPSCLPSAYVYTSGGCGQSVTVAFVPNSLKVGVVFLLGSTNGWWQLRTRSWKHDIRKKVYLELHEQYYNVLASSLSCLYSTNYGIVVRTVVFQLRRLTLSWGRRPLAMLLQNYYFFCFVLSFLIWWIEGYYYCTSKATTRRACKLYWIFDKLYFSGPLWLATTVVHNLYSF